MRPRTEMQRIALLLWIGAFALCGSAALGQPAAKVPRLCFLAFDSLGPGDSRYSPFFERLRELGYVDGRSIAIDWLSANGQSDAFPRHAADCVQRNADVIIVATTPAAVAAKRATSTIPIVMMSLGDPVGTGLVTSLAQPGGNITGMSFMAPQMAAKRLELLKEAVPSLSRVLVLTYPRDPISPGQISALQEAAKSLRVELLIHNVDRPEDIAPGFAAGRKAQVDGVMSTSESIFSLQGTQIIELCRIDALPAVFYLSPLVAAGGLMSYAHDRDALLASGAVLVDKVLKGARPGDLPVEQPTLFKLAINLRTAKALGLAIPPSILARADEVIE